MTISNMVNYRDKISTPEEKIQQITCHFELHLGGITVHNSDVQNVHFIIEMKNFLSC